MLPALEFVEIRSPISLEFTFPRIGSNDDDYNNASAIFQYLPRKKLGTPLIEVVIVTGHTSKCQPLRWIPSTNDDEEARSALTWSGLRRWVVRPDGKGLIVRGDRRFESNVTDENESHGQDYDSDFYDSDEEYFEDSEDPEYSEDSLEDEEDEK